HYAEGQVTPRAGVLGEGFLTSVPRRLQVRPTDEAKAAGFTGESPIPEVWYAHAKFDHSKHRPYDCKQCHAAADNSVTHADGLGPGIQTCKQCHAPARTEAGIVVGGSRYDCVECHRYHHGPRKPPGDAARAEGGAPDLRAFLRARD